MSDVGSAGASAVLAICGGVALIALVGSTALGGNSVCTGGCDPPPSGTGLAVTEPVASDTLGDTWTAGRVGRAAVVGLICSGCPQPVNTSNTTTIQ